MAGDGPNETGAGVAKPNYAFEKRQRDLAKQKKKEEKRLKKAATKEAKTQDAPETTSPIPPGEGTGSG
jgi:hypothetical protein